MHFNSKLINSYKPQWIVSILFFFLIDEVAFILYNISFFQFMCANAFSLFFTDEIPSYTHVDSFDDSNLFLVQTQFSTFFSYCNVSGLVMDIPTVQNTSFLLDESSSFDFLMIKDDLQTTYYKIKLEATNVKKNISSFYPLQQYIYTIPGESSLIFYRLENKTDISLQSLSVYVTTPAEAVAYIKKLQCFCYEELMVAPNSVIDLPILFSIDEEILNEEFKEITINYILLLK